MSGKNLKSTMNKSKPIHVVGPLRKSWRTKKHIIITILIAVILYANFGTVGEIRFYSKWIECGGQMPIGVVPGNLFGGGVPHYYSPNIVEKMMYSSSLDYYCSPRDAELHGYSADPDRYTTPDLTQSEGARVYDKYLCVGCGGPN